MGREALESSSAVLQTAARPSQLPAQQKKPGVDVTPGLYSRDGMGHPSQAQGERRQRYRLIGEATLAFLPEFGAKS